MIVLDTNVASELIRATPDPALARWWRNQSQPELHTTVITVAEIEYGIERLPDGKRRAELRAAAERTFTAFTDRVLAFDQAAAQRYGRILAERERSGRPIQTFDAQIAAICLARGLPLATRNTTDFDDLGLVLINPWITAG